MIVIGAGPIGQTITDRARAAGLSVAAVERELVGGECSYWACIPSKAMLRRVVAVADARRVAGATPDGGTMALSARHAVVICTGSRPALPELARKRAATALSVPQAEDFSELAMVASHGQPSPPALRFGRSSEPLNPPRWMSLRGRGASGRAGCGW